jgi:hypothetical protein
MIILNAADTLSATAGASTALTVTVFGAELLSGAETYKRLYQGQPANTATLLYTAPALTQTLVKTITVANPTGGAQTIAFFQAGTAAANALVPPISIDAGGMAVYDGDGWTFTTISGATKQATSALWSEITGTPTTLGGYGITDAYTKTTSDGRYDVLGAAAAVTPTTLGLVIGVNVLAYRTFGTAANSNTTAFDAAGAAAAVTPTTLGLVIGTNVQAYNANLTAINQALTATSSPSFTTVTAALTGNVTGNVSGTAGSTTLVTTGGTVTTGALTATTLVVTGNVGVGGAAIPQRAIQVVSTLTGSTSQLGILVAPVFDSGATVDGQVLYVRANTVAAAFNIGALYGMQIDTPILGAGSTASHVYGLYISNQTGGGVDNYAIYTGTGLVRFGGVVTCASTLGVTGGFGCNTKAPQTAYASGGLLAGVVAALVANGILSN